MTLVDRLRGENEHLCSEAADEIGRLEAKVAELNRVATDRQYMLWAYRSMLGPQGLEMAKKWDEKRVHRVHHSWGPDAAAMSGEDRAGILLEWEDAFERNGIPIESVDL